MLLTLISGVAWTIVYLESIRVGLKQETYAIPAAALGLNFAWESTYALHGLTTSISAQTIVNLVWMVADCVIVYTYVKFGRRDMPTFVTGSMFAAWNVMLFLTCFVVQWLFVNHFGWNDASKDSAFLQNLLMSGLFIAMFLARGGARGQNLVIAIAKWIGTLAPTVLFGVIGGSLFITGIGVLCSVFDLSYIALLWWARTHLMTQDTQIPEVVRSTHSVQR
jgi:hypothetical protein